MTEQPRTVHLPTGYTHVGKKIRGWCACGYSTTPRVDQARALDALLSEHGYTDPLLCELCDANHSGSVWAAVLRRIEIRDDHDGTTYVVCRGMPKSCQDGAARKQLRLDSAVSAAFGIDLPRPRLRVVRAPGERPGTHS